MKILEGKPIALKILESIKEEVTKLQVSPRLEIFLIGDDIGSVKYVQLKMEAAREVGIKPVLHKYSDEVSQKELIDDIQKANMDTDVNGILVQLPLPSNFDTTKVVNSIDVSKDVDGLTATNTGYMFTNQSLGLQSATAKAVMTILKEYGVSIKGKDVTVVGSSIQVGLPISALMHSSGATVTICNENSKEIDEKILTADIVVSATGTVGIINGNNVASGAVVVDVGYSNVDGKVKGDADSKSLAYIAGALSPVPGGVGPVTIASLLENTLIAYRRQSEENK